MPFAAAGTKLWSNIMEILDEKDGVDTELLVFAMTLINKVTIPFIYPVAWAVALQYFLFFWVSIFVRILLKCNLHQGFLCR